MKRSLLLMPCLLLSIAAFSPVALADDQTPMREIRATAFDEQRASIIEGFADGERYAEIKSDDKTKVLAALDRMSQTLAPGKSIESLSPEAKVAIYNDQEVINTILTDAQEASREVCKRNRTVNSRLKSSECHTVAEWERRRERARELAEKNKRFGGGDR